MCCEALYSVTASRQKQISIGLYRHDVMMWLSACQLEDESKLLLACKHILTVSLLWFCEANHKLQSNTQNTERH